MGFLLTDTKYYATSRADCLEITKSLTENSLQSQRGIWKEDDAWFSVELLTLDGVAEISCVIFTFVWRCDDWLMEALPKIQEIQKIQKSEKSKNSKKSKNPKKTDLCLAQEWMCVFLDFWMFWISWIFWIFGFVGILDSLFFVWFFVVVSKFLIPSQQIVPLNKCVCEKADVFWSHTLLADFVCKT